MTNSIRHLSAVQYDRRDLEIDEEETPIRGIVQWRQFKRAHPHAHGDTTHRSSAHHDALPPRMIYTAEGRREMVAQRVPRYAETLREEMHVAAEALCDLIERATGLVVVRVGYAPGSPNVDVWTGIDGSDDLDELQHFTVTLPKVHKAAHAFATLVAERMATEPTQPVSLWPRQRG